MKTCTKCKRDYDRDQFISLSGTMSKMCTTCRIEDTQLNMPRKILMRYLLGKEGLDKVDADRAMVVYLAMQDMFGDSALFWAHSELKYRVQSVTILQLADYPNYARLLARWTATLNRRAGMNNE